MIRHSVSAILLRRNKHNILYLYFMDTPGDTRPLGIKAILMWLTRSKTHKLGGRTTHLSDLFTQTPIYWADVALNPGGYVYAFTSYLKRGHNNKQNNTVMQFQMLENYVFIISKMVQNSWMDITFLSLIFEHKKVNENGLVRVWFVLNRNNELDLSCVDQN